MPKKYCKANGYFKFYNHDKISVRIKCPDLIENGSVILKFKGEKEERWSYYSPRKIFNSAAEVIHYITTNLENPGLVFKMLPAADDIQSEA